MSMTSIGDLAQSLTLRTRSVQIKQQIETLTQELSSGQTSDVTGQLDGDYSYLSDIDRSLRRLDAFRTATAEAGLFTSAMQSGLEQLQGRVLDLSENIIATGPFGQELNREQIGIQAREDLRFMVATLNTSAGGRSLFSGVDTDTVPLNSDSDLLAGLGAAITGQPTVGDLIQAAKDWFADPAGFDAVIYNGADRDLAALQVSDTEKVDIPIRADHPGLKQMMRNTALLALATDPALGLTAAEQGELIETVGAELLETRDGLTEIRAEIGFAEARVEEARVRNVASQTSLEYARAELIEADPFDVATRLEAAQFQLESLYTATVRTSRLSLVNFLR